MFAQASPQSAFPTLHTFGQRRSQPVLSRPAPHNSRPNPSKIAHNRTKSDQNRTSRNL